MRKLGALLLMLCLSQGLGTLSARAEERELVPVSIEYVLEGRVIHTLQRILLDEELERLPENLRASFSPEYEPEEGNDWLINEGLARIYLRRRASAPPQTGDSLFTAAALLLISGAGMGLTFLKARRQK